MYKAPLFPSPQVGAGEEAGAWSWDRGSCRRAPPRLWGSENTSQIHFSQPPVIGWGPRLKQLGRLANWSPKRWGEGWVMGWQRAYNSLWYWIAQRATPGWAETNHERPSIRGSWGRSCSCLGLFVLPILCSSEGAASPAGQTSSCREGNPTFPEPTNRGTLRRSFVHYN